MYGKSNLYQWILSKCLLSVTLCKLFPSNVTELYFSKLHKLLLYLRTMFVFLSNVGRRNCHIYKYRVLQNIQRSNQIVHKKMTPVTLLAPDGG